MLIGGAGALLASGCTSFETAEVSRPEIVYDLSATPELDPIVAEQVGKAVVVIYMQQGSGEWLPGGYSMGTGFTVQEDSLPEEVMVYTAGHVISADGLMNPCDGYNVQKKGTHEISFRAGLFDGGSSMHGEDSSVDIGMLGVDDVQNVLTSRLEISYDPAETQPGTTLYVATMQYHADENTYKPIAFPVLITGNRSGRLDILSGIGAGEFDDALSGMSGSPLVTANGKVVAVLVTSWLNRAPKPSIYYGQDGAGRLKIIGQSKDGEETRDLIADGRSQDGTILRDFNFGKGFMPAGAQLLTPELAGANTLDRADCDSSVPIQTR